MPPKEHAATLDRLRATTRDLVALLGTATGDQLRKVPAPGEWPASTVLTHLADAELVYGMLLRLVVAEETPTLPAFDGNAWTDRFGSLEDPKDSLDRWRATRASTVRILESLADAEWDRSGVHAKRGEVTVANIAGRLAEHDATHLSEIRACFAAR